MTRWLVASVFLLQSPSDCILQMFNLLNSLLSTVHHYSTNLIRNASETPLKSALKFMASQWLCCPERITVSIESSHISCRMLACFQHRVEKQVNSTPCQAFQKSLSKTMSVWSNVPKLPKLARAWRFSPIPKGTSPVYSMPSKPSTLGGYSSGKWSYAKVAVPSDSLGVCLSLAKPTGRPTEWLVIWCAWTGSMSNPYSKEWRNHTWSRVPLLDVLLHLVQPSCSIPAAQEYALLLRAVNSLLVAGQIIYSGEGGWATNDVTLVAEIVLSGLWLHGDRRFNNIGDFGCRFHLELAVICREDWPQT